MFRGTGAKVGVIDPMGSDIPPGPDYHGAPMLSVARAFTVCG
ncbi:MAG: hypothetical protein RI571_13570 [Roseovarius sp.]|nr:hypothetical protein [Roseovarius sp.]